MTKVAVLLADGFETIEALTVVDILRRADVTCHTFALEGLEVCSSHKISIKADNNIDNDEIKDYDCIVLPGGMPGASNLKADDRVINLVKDFNNKGKLICAICAAPIVLGKAGITGGKDMTCYPGFEKEIEGCNYKEELVVSFENIITGKGPASSIDFAFEILSRIKPDIVGKIRTGMLF